MAETRHHPILNYLRQVLGAEASGGVADAELVRRFVSSRDEAAFELLLWRHAGMVLHVCRQILRDTQAVEDAFQATFLVFIRKAASVSRRESLGGWLYRVAYRIALKSRSLAKRQASTDAELERLEAPAEADDADQRELRRLICEEVNRLPPKYRAPIVACYFEAKTHEEAAQQLGWPRGTVAGRLSRAREMLHRRLVRRGVTLTAGAFAAALPMRSSQAALTRLIDTTIQTAKLFAAGRSASVLVSPRVAALAEGVLTAMYWTRVKIGMAVLLVLGLGGASAALWATQRDTVEQPGESAPSAGTASASGGAERQKPAEADKLADAGEQSRANLKKLALAMVNYADTHQGRMPAPAIYGKDGKALLSWRVAILPYLDLNSVYQQFHLDEPWDSPHNRKLLETSVPKVYAPVGKTDIPRWRTYYQVFVSSPSAGQGGGAGMMGGAGPGGGPMGAGSGGGMGSMIPGGGAPSAGGSGGPPGGSGAMMMKGGAADRGAPMAEISYPAAFVKGVQVPFPVHFTDGTSNTILIVEAGNAVPWTKPEDLHFANDEPLPELGGLFPDVFNAAFADGTVHTLTKNYDEKVLRAAITANAGEVTDLDKIEAGKARPSSASGDLRQQLREEGERMRELLRINEKLLQETDRNREQINRLLEAKQKLLEEMLQDTKRSRGTETKRPVQKKGP
jgi:RNA polymerase sigma factor (sigma-70 family)